MSRPHVPKLLVRLLIGSLLFLLPSHLPATEPESKLRAEAIASLRRAAQFYREQVASHGGYVYYYRLDLSRRWGEGECSRDTIFVQPPGTPAVGMAYLQAWRSTKDKYYLDAARDTAGALIYGQLESGGWTQQIHFAPAERMGQYRNGRGGKWNNSSLDDNQSQSALKFLIELDQALEFRDAELHAAAQYGCSHLLAAQFPNGGFPQVWSGPVEQRPVLTASFPVDNARTIPREKHYWEHYTLNDGLAGTVCETLITAHTIYREEKFLAALRRLGDFLLLAQMPAPQPGWCQQYDARMQPAWARKFEPPAIAGTESRDAMETLIRIARHTGDRKYLAPVPAAIEYFKTRCVLADGRTSRFYELKTNQPLYMNRAYQFTYSDADLPTHYSWKSMIDWDRLAEQHRAALENRPVKTAEKKADHLAPLVREVIDELDEQGRWVSVFAGESLSGRPDFKPGERYLSSQKFIRNMEILARYIEAH